MNKKQNLVWIDLEMTGLKPEVDVILEAALIITDNELNILHKGPDIVIHQPQALLHVMDDWVKNQHAKSGLIQAVERSTISIQQAQEELLEVIQEFCEPKTSPLCGNTVWQDANFLRVYMPHLMNYLHYRVIDVSTVKELAKRWYPASPHKEFKKQDTHRALSDIEESIAELRHYRDRFFIK